MNIVDSSKLSLEHQIPMADSIIMATAQEFKAIIWTQDSDFKNISKVKYFPKKWSLSRQSSGLVTLTADLSVGSDYIVAKARYPYWVPVPGGAGPIG